MKSRRDETEIVAALHSLRSTLRPEFAAELDARAAAGFPRRHEASPGFSRLVEQLRAVPPRRLLAPASGCAVLAIAVASAVIAISEDGTPFRGTPSDTAQRFADSAAPRSGAMQKAESERRGDDSSVQFSEAPPMARSEAPSVAPASGNAAGTQSAGPFLAEPAGPGPYASRTAQRDIERSAQIVLGADPADVRGYAAEVFDAVHAADGIVLSSSVRDGAPGEAGADFDLLIPSGKLGDALAAFSAIAEVRSRRESTQDITAPTVRVGEKLQDVRAKIESLLIQLAEAEPGAERLAVEAALRAARRHVAVLRSNLTTLQRRANFSRVSLRIETGAPAVAEDEGGAWGLGDGFDGAGRILAIAAGVTVIGLAVLGPFALIALIAWLAHRTWVRRRREQALA